jgi:hypothetical protein
MDRMNRAMESIQRDMMAAAFAEAGEFQVARDIAGDREVLLVYTGHEADSKALKYAANFATRIGARLHILCSGEWKKGLPSIEAELKDKTVTYALSETKGCLREAVVEAVNGNGKVHSVVVNLYRTLESGCEGHGETLAHIWNSIQCPIIVVGA